MRYSSIDIFCRVIDNFGDAGVVYRFAKEFLLAHPACRTRIFCDNLEPLSAMCPGVDAAQTVQERRGIVIVNSLPLSRSLACQLGAADVVVEAFGCDIPEQYAAIMPGRSSIWINLEYLSAEPWVDGYHMKHSMLKTGEIRKYFFMPGFTKGTGGVIVDSEVEAEKPALRANRGERLNDVLEQFGLRAKSLDGALFGTVFTYGGSFDGLLAGIGAACDEGFLFICGDKSRQGMLSTLQKIPNISVSGAHYRVGNTHVLMMPFVPQHSFDTLLCLADFNLVRGEDSLVRAILAEKPFLWSAYVQEKNYHQIKVDAFCGVLGKYFEDKTAFASYRELTKSINAEEGAGLPKHDGEMYDLFFNDLKKIEHSTRAMSYFITRNCSLVEKLTDFLSGI